MDILQIIYEGINEMNLDLDLDSQIEKSEKAVIFGSESKLDSMDLVNLITLIEERLEDASGKFISLADERAMSLEQSPFKTVGSLKNYIETLISEK